MEGRELHISYNGEKVSVISPHEEKENKKASPTPPRKCIVIS